MTLLHRRDVYKRQVICNVNGEERIDGNTEPHPHFVCNKCKAVIDVEDNQNADDLESHGRIPRAFLQPFQAVQPGFFHGIPGR